MSRQGDYRYLNAAPLPPFELSTEKITWKQGESVAFYEKDIRSRDIFLTPFGAKIQHRGSSRPEPDAENVIAPSALGSYQLQGVLLDKDPQAVVFDPMTGETFLLRSGDHLKDAELIEIAEDRVVFRTKSGLSELKF